ARERDPERRRAALEAALLVARQAFDGTHAEEALAPKRAVAARRLVGILLELERVDEVPALLEHVPEAAVIECELLRRRGDVAGAIERARTVYDPANAPRHAPWRAHVHAVLALAEADRGDVAAARRHCDV